MQVLSVTEPRILSTGLAVVDTRAKMAVSMLASLATMFLSRPEAQLALFSMSLVYALGMRRIMVLLGGYALVAALCALALGCARGIHALLPTGPEVELQTMLVPFLRLLTMLNVILPLAFTCRVQRLLAALKSLRLPFCIYIPAAVMIRFIPTFLSDVRQVVETLRIRGYRPGIRECLRHPGRMVRLMFTPLIFRSLQTSETLGMAAELKGLGYGDSLRPYTLPRWQSRDTLLLLSAFATVAWAVFCELQPGGFPAGGMR